VGGTCPLPRPSCRKAPAPLPHPHDDMSTESCLTCCFPARSPERQFLGIFLFSAFLGVSQQGAFKNAVNIFFPTSPCRKLFPKKFDVSFPSTSFVLSRFRVILSDGSSKTLQKTFCKKRPKVQNRFFTGFVYHVFGRFSVRAARGEINVALSHFWQGAPKKKKIESDVYLADGQ
jgi:hypothetical protein